jgi:hypothetical protein
VFLTSEEPAHKDPVLGDYLSVKTIYPTGYRIVGYIQRVPDA